MRPLICFMLISALFVWDIAQNGGHLFAQVSPFVNSALASVGLL